MESPQVDFCIDSSNATYNRQQNTSKAVCEAISVANMLPPMTTRRSLTPEERAESIRLKAIYEARKAEAKALGKNLTQADVAEACGWAGQSAFSQYATAKVPLNVEALLKLARALSFHPTDVSPRLMEMLQPGIGGRMVKPQDHPAYKGPSELPAISAWDDETPMEDDEVSVPFLREVELSAGAGLFAIEVSEKAGLRFSKQSLRQNGVQFANARCVTVRGNSMLPVLRDGATVGVNLGRNSIGDITDGDLYALNHSGQLRVKQVYRMPTGIRLRSFNRDEHPDEDYPFQQIQNGDIVIIGHVFWWGMYAR